MEGFAHLHQHSHKSMLDGFGTEEQLAERAKELGLTHLAITDHGTAAGLFSFYNACKDNDIEPILGVEFYTAPQDLRKKRLDIGKFEKILINHTDFKEGERGVVSWTRTANSVDKVFENVDIDRSKYEDFVKDYLEFYKEYHNLNYEESFKMEYYERLVEIYRDTFKVKKRNFDKAIRDKEKELDIADRRHLIVLAKNMEGVRALYRLVTKSNLEGFHEYWNLSMVDGKPRIDKKSVLEEYEKTDGSLVVLSACSSGVINKEYFKNGAESAYNLAKEYKEDFGDDFYLEIQPHILFGVLDDNSSDNKDIQLEFNKFNIRLSNHLDIKLISTNDNHWIKKEDEEAQQVLLAINNKEKWDNPNRFKFSTTGFHMRTYEEMIGKFKEQGFKEKQIEKYIKPSLTTNIQEILDKIDIEYPIYKELLPPFDLPDRIKEKDMDDFIEELKDFGFKDLSNWGGEDNSTGSESLFD